MRRGAKGHESETAGTADEEERPTEGAASPNLVDAPRAKTDFEPVILFSSRGTTTSERSRRAFFLPELRMNPEKLLPQQTAYSPSLRRGQQRRTVF